MVELKRYGVIDIIRALAIILVVFGHAERGLVEKEILDENLFGQIDFLIYTFHMPVFFVLSGIFIQKTVEKSDTLSFFESRFWGLVYPYFLWSFLTLLSKELASSVTAINDERGVAAMAMTLYRPIGIFWFLYALFMYQSAFFVVRRPVIFLSFALLLSALASAIGSTGTVFNILAYHAPFFAIGIVIGGVRFSKILQALTWYHTATAATVFAAGVYICIKFHIGPAVSFVTIPISIAGMMLVAVIASLLSKTSASPALQKIGKWSLPIYLMHLFPLALVPRLVSAAGGAPDSILLIFCVVLGVGLPMVVMFVATKLGLADFLALTGKRPFQRDRDSHQT